MTQEEEELLLKDLCARLPYGVKILYENEIFEVEHVCPMYGEVKLENEYCTIGVSGVKPYLFPISSMTEEQENEWYQLHVQPLFDRLGVNNRKEDLILQAKSLYMGTDWLNANHFDYRGLIPIGLANDATNLNIY